MTRLDLRNLVLYWLDDLAGDYFTPTQVNAWLNNAQKEVQKYLLQAGENFYYKCIETTLVTNQQDYQLPEDFYDVLRLEVVLSGLPPNESKRQLPPMTLNQQDMIGTNTSDPYVYVLTKSNLKLFPTPNRALTLRLYYSYRVADMASDIDVPDVPDEYQEAIAIFAAYDGFIKDDRAPQNLVDKYKAYVDLFKKAAEDRSDDQSRQVIVTQSDGYGVMF